MSTTVDAPIEVHPKAAETLSEHDHTPKINNMRDLALLSLGALGVVYGDIGTSPLYAIKECFHPHLGLQVTEDNVLGILSLFFWSLTMVVVIKYLTFVMKADNNGEGGILALLSLVAPKTDINSGLSKNTRILVMVGLFGAALLFADGIITPAISVLSAIEGLEVATPIFKPFIVPITVAILIGIFWMQKRGTANIAAIFGPAMLVWFGCIGFLGLVWIAKQPQVLWALNPWWALRFLLEHQLHGFLVLGAVVLCITGSEALYADMGHFGRVPIRTAWYVLVYPALLLNYFGQGAALVDQGVAAVENPFYFLAPSWFLYPMVVIATIATIIASQALISGVFSLAQQSIQLGYTPRLTIKHTSEGAQGQIYIPEMNTILMIGCIVLVLTFKSSSNLAAAYGIAVMGTMTITTILLYAVMKDRWKWPLWKVYWLTGIFLLIDLVFLFSNITKIFHGGWFPLLVSAVIFLLLTTWKLGQTSIAGHIIKNSLPLDMFMEDIQRSQPHRVKGTAVFLTSNPQVAPLVLLHHYKHNQVIHERVILLSIATENVPFIPIEESVYLEDLGCGFYLLRAKIGFMQSPNVPKILRRTEPGGTKLNIQSISYYLGNVKVLTHGKVSKLPRWRKDIFAFMYRNARPATAFFHIPANRVIELGMQLEL